MTTTKIFQHGGSQAVHIPKDFRFEGTEVQIERRNGEIILKPVIASGFMTFAEIASYLAKKFPDAENFPEPPPRPARHERSISEF